ncbi:MAG TPA: alpha-ketoglutarate-dependent dioxygenase AlkB [Verrucomicrobiae bacterium]|nr:alpha-ketoglutarate-dependent dioxygenase AlkB [Verrucomicrobiae bacterium]
MNLFQAEPERNLLPYDGIVNYHGPILEPADAQLYLDTLLKTVPWKHDEALIYGKHIQTARKVAWYGDSEFSYTYSGTTKVALLWTKELLSLKYLVEQKTSHTFNSCLCNLYNTGGEGMSWHSDDEKALGKNTIIASLTLGAERKFNLRHKTKRANEPISILLEHGSLLVMKGATQTYWQHSVPKTAKIASPRINLTFRTIILQDEQRRISSNAPPLPAANGGGLNAQTQ